STTTSAIPCSSRSHVIPTADEPTGDLTKRQIPPLLPFGAATTSYSRGRGAKSVGSERGDVEVRGRLAAAVDGEVGAAHVLGERGREEHAGVADVVGVGDAAERDGGTDLGDALLVAVEEVRLLGAH